MLIFKKNIYRLLWSIGLLFGLSLLVPLKADTEITADSSSTPDALVIDANDSIPVFNEPPLNSELFTYKLSLKELGATYPLNLRGVEGSDTVEFSVRPDEVVTKALLDIRYVYSPALLTEYSHINVLLNDEVAMSLPMSSEEAGTSIKQQLDLPTYLITEKNRLRLQLIGHYTLECEDPMHSSLWANISNLSEILLTTDSVELPNDLSLLPLPFIDRIDNTPLHLPFVFLSSPDESTVEAAGIVASWFGKLAGKRGVHFPVKIDSVYSDQEHAVIFVNTSESQIDNTDFVQGPALAIKTNPKNPFTKLLLVMGRNTEEIKQAAQALVLGADVLSGQEINVTQLIEIAPRKPYDAPNWLPTDRAVRLGELVGPKELNVNGYTPLPIRVPMHVAPDLFTWRAKPVPLDLRFRYTPQIGETNSALIINTNDQFLGSFPLFSSDQLTKRDRLTQALQSDMLPVHGEVNIPLSRLIPNTELQFKYMYNYIKEGECRDIIIDNVRGEIDPDSTIDLTGYSHFMAMPNLAAFRQSGFPFTRLADLSETLVILSSSATHQEISTYLTVLGHFGDITGYPAVGVTVGFGKEALSLGQDKDILMIEMGEPEWLKEWGDYMPAFVEGMNKRYAISDLVYKKNAWFMNNQENPRSYIGYSNDSASAFFAGFESPLKTKRSVVLMASNQPAGLEMATNALLSDNKALTGSLAVVREGKVSALVSETTYQVGDLKWYKRLEWELAKYWPNMPRIEIVFYISLGFLLFICIILWRRSSRSYLRQKQE